MKRLITLLLSLTFVSNAFAFDVSESNSSIYVKVEMTGDHVSFSQCDTKTPDSPCPQIGEYEYYTLNELRDQRKWEIAKASGAGISDALIFVGALAGSVGIEISALIAAPIAAASAGTADIAIICASVGGAVGVSAAGTYFATKLKVLNPAHFVDQKDAINEDVITDRMVSVKNIDNFISDLEGVLSNIKR